MAQEEEQKKNETEENEGKEEEEKRLDKEALCERLKMQTKQVEWREFIKQVRNSKIILEEIPINLKMSRCYNWNTGSLQQ